MLKIKISDRIQISPRHSLLSLIFSLLAGMGAISLIFLVFSVNPIYAFTKIFVGSFGSFYGLKETVTKAIPLILIGSGLALAFRCKFWNIGAESQLLMGAIFGTWVGATFAGSSCCAADLSGRLAWRRPLGADTGDTEDQILHQRSYLYPHAELYLRRIFDHADRRALEGKNQVWISLHR